MSASWPRPGRRPEARFVTSRRSVDRFRARLARVGWERGARPPPLPTALRTATSSPVDVAVLVTECRRAVRFLFNFSPLSPRWEDRRTQRRTRDPGDRLRASRTQPGRKGERLNPNLQGAGQNLGQDAGSERSLREHGFLRREQVDVVLVRAAALISGDV